MKQETVPAVVLIATLLLLPAAAQDEPPPRPRRLTDHPGDSRVTYNFSRTIASEGETVHLVWYDRRDGESQIYYRRSENDGETWTSGIRLSTRDKGNAHPAVAVQDKNVYAVWHGPGSTPEDGMLVRFRRSTDAGETWKPEITLTDSASAAHASLALSGRRIYVVWGDNRSGHAEIYLRRSLDGGTTWKAETRLTDFPFTSWVPSVAADGDLVVLAWVDGRDGNEEEYVKISADGGESWGPDTRITKNRMNSWAPSVAVEDDTIHLVWFDQLDTKFHAYDAEAKIDEALRMLGIEPEPMPKGVLVSSPEAEAKARAAEKAKLVEKHKEAWVRDGGNPEKLAKILRELQKMSGPHSIPPEAKERLDEARELVGLKKIEDEPFEKTVRRIGRKAPEWVSSGGDPKELERLMRRFHEAAEAGDVPTYVEKEKKLDEALKLMGLEYTPGPKARNARKDYYLDVQRARIRRKMRRIQQAGPKWVENGGDPKKIESLFKEFKRRMEIATHEWEIYYRRSDDRGETWTEPARLTRAPGNSARPHLSVDNDELHIVWFDDRDGNSEIYTKRSDDGGDSWGPDVRLTREPSPSSHAMAALTDDGLHVVWFDERDGNAEIYTLRRPRKGE